MHLAAHMRVPLVKVLEGVPAEEWDVWLAYTNRFPLGPRQEDYRAAVAAAALGGAEALELFPSLRPPADRSGRSFRQWALAHAPAHRPAGSGH